MSSMQVGSVSVRAALSALAPDAGQLDVPATARVSAPRHEDEATNDEQGAQPFLAPAPDAGAAPDLAAAGERARS
jgi:hypothetical protein